MKQVKCEIQGIPAVIYGEDSPGIYLFVHGKMGCKEEAAAFAEIACPRGWQVLGVDLPCHGERKDEKEGFDPMHAVPELKAVWRQLNAHWEETALRATSIGAWFSMLALSDTPPLKSLFVSPVADMARLIRDMLSCAGVSEQQLMLEGKIATNFGETLDRDYYSYAKSHPITRWDSPTEILYADGDGMIARDTVEAFTKAHGCSLTVMPGGEHWFHTPRQLEYLDNWTRERV